MHIYPCMCILTYKCIHTYTLTYSYREWEEGERQIYSIFKSSVTPKFWASATMKILNSQERKAETSSLNRLQFNSSKLRDCRTSLRLRMNLFIRDEEENILTVPKLYFKSRVADVSWERKHFCMWKLYLKQFWLEELVLWMNVSEAKIWHRSLIIPP